MMAFNASKGGVSWHIMAVADVHLFLLDFAKSLLYYKVSLLSHWTDTTP